MDDVYREHVRLTGGHTAGIAAAAFSPHGKLLATAGLDGNLCIWDVSGGDLVHVHQGNSAALSISWTPEDEDSLQYGTEDGYLVNLIISQVSGALSTPLVISWSKAGTLQNDGPCHAGPQLPKRMP